jgi:crotonobetainyl-CoA:carnitine CoA-transferase CaiB-like acyl-CoA transferase
VVQTLATPIRYADTPPREPRYPPALGEDAAAILAELGYEPSTVAEMVASGAVTGSSRLPRPSALPTGG